MGKESRELLEQKLSLKDAIENAEKLLKIKEMMRSGAGGGYRSQIDALIQEVMNCNNRPSLFGDVRPVEALAVRKVQTDESNTNSGPFQPKGNVLSFETPTKNYNALSLPPRDSDDVINR